MQIVCNETGVPADTLRSWERRYGFPQPARNDSNRRLYSQRDIVAVAWLRDQSERGQGISEAITMVRRVLHSPPPVPLSVAETNPSPGETPRHGLIPVQTLTDALLAGNLAEAQSAWDHLAMAISSEAMCNDVLLPAHDRMTMANIAATTRKRSSDFLRRKAIVLFDQASPDRGIRDIVLLTHGTAASTVPALALGTILSRSGFRLAHPILDATDAATLITLRETPVPSLILVGPASDITIAEGYDSLLPAVEVRQWWHIPDARGEGDSWLPAHLLAVPQALADQG